MHVNKSLAGFSLIEVIISAALVATSVGAFFAIASMSTRLSLESQDRLAAGQFAREGLEIVRHVRDANFVAGGCYADFACDNWYTNIFDLGGSRPPVVKGIDGDVQNGYRLSTQSLGGTTKCADFITRDLTDGSITITHTTPALQAKKQIFCRRIWLEPIDLPYTTDNEATSFNAIRVRSQVAWTGYGRNLLRTPPTPVNDNSCPTDASATEWCIDDVSILTNWRPQL